MVTCIFSVCTSQDLNCKNQYLYQNKLIQGRVNDWNFKTSQFPRAQSEVFKKLLLSNKPKAQNTHFLVWIKKNCKTANTWNLAPWNVWHPHIQMGCGMSEWLKLTETNFFLIDQSIARYCGSSAWRTWTSSPDFLLQHNSNNCIHVIYIPFIGRGPSPPWWEKL